MRRGFAALAGACTVTLAGVVGVVVVAARPAERAATPAPPPVEVVPAAQPARAVAPRLPQPEDSPTDPYADVAVVAIGEIEIPTIGVREALYEGVWLTVVDHGPGHWPGSAEPGGYGNAVVAGHRVTNSRPFRRIDELRPGDPVVFRTADGTFTYRVTGHQIVGPEDTFIVDQTPGHRMTLFACHPPGSAALRYVVTGELDAREPTTAAPPL